RFQMNRYCLAFDLESPFTGCRIVSPILETCLTPRTSRRFEASAGIGFEPLPQEGLVHLFNVGINAPVFAVDHDAHPVGTSSWYEIASRLQVQNRMKKARIRMRVEQVQGCKSEQILTLHKSIH